jgi:hypothetical protein
MRNRTSTRRATAPLEKSSWRLFGDLVFLAGVTKWPKLLKSLARPEGFEPPTPRSVVWCSVQLSYGRRSVDICRAKLLGFTSI